MFKKPCCQFLQGSKLDISDLDDKAARVLRLIFRTEMNRQRPYGALNTPGHYAAARKIGDEGIVLLKNRRGILPIDSKRHKRVLVIGENAIKMMTVGGGSSSLKVQREILPLEGISRRADAAGIEVVYQRGYVGDVTGEYNGVTTGQDLNDRRSAGQLIADATEQAMKSDMVIFIGGLNKSDRQDAEGNDRAAFELPYNQDAVIDALSKVNPNLVVVTLTGNAFAMPWVDNVAAIVQGWYIGSESGESLADVLFGDVNPSGKLPITFAKSLADYAPHSYGEKTVYPGQGGDVLYKEGLEVGYRHTDRLKPNRINFPFGHGLSYTTFRLGKPDVKECKDTGRIDITIEIPVSNTGGCSGSEVIQAYVRDVKGRDGRPVKELKAFDKVCVQPGQTVSAKLTLDRTSFASFDPDKAVWAVQPGQYEILIGTSSANIAERIPVVLNEYIAYSDAEQ